MKWRDKTSGIMKMVHGLGAMTLPVLKNHGGLTVLFTGLSSAGKTTLSDAVEAELCNQGYRVEHLDGDVLRQNLCKGLGYSREDREENLRRMGFVAELLMRHGVIVLISAIAPYASSRAEMRERCGDFAEVYVSAPLAVCEERDRKGIYRRARAGQIDHVTGVDDPYETPTMPDLICLTNEESVRVSAQRVLEMVIQRVTM